eukprot:PRCOL_00005665-RA
MDGSDALPRRATHARGRPQPDPICPGCERDRVGSVRHARARRAHARPRPASAPGAVACHGEILRGSYPYGRARARAPNPRPCRATTRARPGRPARRARAHPRARSGNRRHQTPLLRCARISVGFSLKKNGGGVSVWGARAPEGGRRRGGGRGRSRSGRLPARRAGGRAGGRPASPAPQGVTASPPLLSDPAAASAAPPAPRCTRASPPTPTRAGGGGRACWPVRPPIPRWACCARRLGRGDSGWGEGARFA